MIADHPPAEVRAVFDAMPEAARAGALRLRRAIQQEAGALPVIGPVVEALRWGQPAFLTPQTGAACSLRIGLAGAGQFGIFVHCRTSLIAEFKAMTGGRFATQGTRAVLFASAQEIDEVPLGFLIRGALTYHLHKR
ncbi:MAG: DUF1801 domain-containing protein [Albidovulum sp.]